MTALTRRGLLGMFAAGAAAAVLPSGIIMPVRRIVAPRVKRIHVLGDSIWEGVDPSAAGDAAVLAILGQEAGGGWRALYQTPLPAPRPDGTFLVDFGGNGPRLEVGMRIMTTVHRVGELPHERRKALASRV